MTRAPALIATLLVLGGVAPCAATAQQPAAQQPPTAEVGIEDAAQPASNGGAERAAIDPSPQPAPATAAPTPDAATRPLEPGEMTPQEVREYFRERRAFMRSRYDHPLTLGLSSGYTWAIADPGVNPYRVSLGAVAGYTIPLYDVYVGLSGQFFNGESSASGATNIASGEYSSTRLTLDVGPEAIFRYVRARALVIGGASLVDTPDSKKVVPTFGVGGTLMVPLSLFYVAAEYRLALMFGGEDAATHNHGWQGILGARL